MIAQIVSDVLDAKIISKWGSLLWKAHVPEGTRVSVAVRSGNVAEHDETWSDWSAEQADRQDSAPERRAALLDQCPGQFVGGFTLGGDQQHFLVRRQVAKPCVRGVHSLVGRARGKGLDHVGCGDTPDRIGRSRTHPSPGYS